MSADTRLRHGRFYILGEFMLQAQHLGDRHWRLLSLPDGRCAFRVEPNSQLLIAHAQHDLEGNMTTPDRPTEYLVSDLEEVPSKRR